MTKRIIGALCAATLAGSVLAQTAGTINHDAAAAEFDKVRAEMEQDNPAELFEMKGEELWKAKRGALLLLILGVAVRQAAVLRQCVPVAPLA